MMGEIFLHIFHLSQAKRCLLAKWREEIFKKDGTDLHEERKEITQRGLAVPKCCLAVSSEHKEDWVVLPRHQLKQGQVAVWVQGKNVLKIAPC